MQPAPSPSISGHFSPKTRPSWPSLASVSSEQGSLDQQRLKLDNDNENGGRRGNHIASRVHDATPCLSPPKSSSSFVIVLVIDPLPPPAPKPQPIQSASPCRRATKPRLRARFHVFFLSLSCSCSCSLSIPHRHQPRNPNLSNPHPPAVAPPSSEQNSHRLRPFFDSRFQQRPARRTLRPHLFPQSIALSASNGKKLDNEHEKEDENDWGYYPPNYPTRARSLRSFTFLLSKSK
jgi:hypothetical protein